MYLLLAAQTISLKPDSTVIWQLIIFLSLIFILTIFVFRPVLKILEGRKQETLELEKETERLLADAKKLDSDYAGIISKARSEGGVAEQRLVSEGGVKARATISEAREEAKGTITRARDKIRYEGSKTGEELSKKIDEYTKMIISKVLGKNADDK
jgi:F-type H+-transporting ATPase subunit b